MKKFVTLYAVLFVFVCTLAINGCKPPEDPIFDAMGTWERTDVDEDGNTIIQSMIFENSETVKMGSRMQDNSSSLYLEFPYTKDKNKITVFFLDKGFDYTLTSASTLKDESIGIEFTKQ